MFLTGFCIAGVPLFLTSVIHGHKRQVSRGVATGPDNGAAMRDSKVYNFDDGTNGASTGDNPGSEEDVNILHQI